MKLRDRIKTFIPARWKTLLALMLALFAVIYHWLFVWGIFCLFWGWENLRAKEAYFVERIERSENPVLYWIIIAIWVGMGLFYFYIDETVFNFLSRF